MVRRISEASTGPPNPWDLPSCIPSAAETFKGGRVTDPGTVQMRRGSLEDERTSDFLFYSILVDVCVMDLVIFDWNLSETNSGSTTQSFEHQNYSQSQNKPFLRNPSSEAEKKAVQTTKNLGTLDQPDQESGNSPINHTHLTHLWNLSPQKNPQKQRSALFAGWNRPLKKLWSLERSSSREPWGEPAV